MTATASITATTSWAATSVTGVARVNLQNIGTTDAGYFVGTSEPASSYVGMELSPGDLHPVDVATGETLYVKSYGPGSVALRAGYAL